MDKSSGFIVPVRNGTITLRRYDVSERVFDELLSTLESKIKIVSREDLEDSFCGYPDKDQVLYDGDEYIICREHFLALVAEFSESDWGDVDRWRQVIVRKDESLRDSYKPGIDGSRAYQIVKRAIESFYPGDEYEKQLLLHSAEYDREKVQYHYIFPSDPAYVCKHKCCVKYDMNGAHLDALVEIFPKAKDYLQRLFDDRKKHPLYKAYANYFVGMLKRKKHSGTYNWIVQRTTKKLKEAIKECGGYLVYANTDGFIVSYPDKTLQTSCNLGEFKLEYSGDVFTYIGGNYWALQAGEEMKGSISYKVRGLLDIPNGRVVSYKIQRPRTVNNDSNRIVISDVKELNVQVYEEGN